MRFHLVLIFVVSLLSAPAYADRCAHSRSLAAEFDLAGVDTIDVQAVSGDLRVIGVTSASRVRVEGRACVGRDEKDRLDEISIVEERDGHTLRIIANVPLKHDDDWRIGGLDLVLNVPDDLPLLVTDSSGDIEIDDIHSLRLSDSSGEVQIENVAGAVVVDRDSSGSLEIRNAGDVEIHVDSSGDIDVRNVRSLHIGRDSSGSITAREIALDLAIDADSSGDIVVADVGGSFTVGRDGSGEIRHRNVGGAVSLPDDD